MHWQCKTSLYDAATFLKLVSKKSLQISIWHNLIGCMCKKVLHHQCVEINLNNMSLIFLQCQCKKLYIGTLHYNQSCVYDMIKLNCSNDRECKKNHNEWVSNYLNLRERERGVQWEDRIAAEESMGIWWECVKCEELVIIEM